MKIYKVKVNGKVYEVALESVSESKETIKHVESAPATPVVTPTSGGNEVKAPVGGSILDVRVKVGDVVKANQCIAIIEAMKLENEIVTPFAGTVTSVLVSKGDSANPGQVLITVA